LSNIIVNSFIPCHHKLLKALMSQIILLVTILFLINLGDTLELDIILYFNFLIKYIKNVKCYNIQ